MRVNRDTLRELVREVMSELDESDLVVRKDDGRTWEEMSNELKSDVDSMINNITADKYQAALEDISGISATMKIWRRRILMGGAKAKKPEQYKMDRFNLTEKNKVEKDNPKLYPDGWKDMSGIALDIHKHFKK